MNPAWLTTWTTPEEDGKVTLSNAYNYTDFENYVLIKDYEVVTTSVDIAIVFNRKHSTIIKYIRQLFRMPYLSRDLQLLKALQCFTYRNQNDIFEAYYVNRYGFDLIVSGIVHKNKPVLWGKYVKAFYQKQDQLNLMIEHMSETERFGASSLLSIKELQVQWQYNRIWCNT